MSTWKDVLLTPDTSIIQAMKLIDETTMQFAAVVEVNGRLLGTVTDGDIRRGILKGLALDSSIDEVMNQSPHVVQQGKHPSAYRRYMKQYGIKQLPVVDEKGNLLRIIFSDELKRSLRKDNKVVLMAGGLGTRLRPLTESIPKPMLNVGNKPILETIIEGFKNYGFEQFILTVNYKKEIVKDYFQDGSHLGVNIGYIEEDKRLGTAGALSLLAEIPDQPIFVMNGDLLTKINFEQLLDFHLEAESKATMCVREYEYQIPYGVIETENDRLLSIVEKPVHKSFVNAGVYVLNSEALEYIPRDAFFDMPQLFGSLMRERQNVCAFPLREYWLDIGRMADFEKANGDYGEIFYD
ncbi:MULTISPECIES: nucleotidyltransferase family protein [Sporosarcina]|uniref:CBS domain-containing protein n=1 Tax=Sporosarcina newyorkensis TaxID=759851 RepID=A0A1T4Y1M0_9BACL|nr:MULTISPECIES: nucleotidyltransferase family protein [Sporosarcina]MBY0223488.1 nucleotidyltransferase family protein [Sporosarcina aquimarina]SKA95692.1 CBS domain-containing protein [Sporosarcina newyorkensis]